MASSGDATPTQVTAPSLGISGIELDLLRIEEGDSASSGRRVPTTTISTKADHDDVNRNTDKNVNELALLVRNGEYISVLSKLKLFRDNNSALKKDHHQEQEKEQLLACFSVVFVVCNCSCERT